MKKWKAQEEGRRESPTVRLLFSNLRDDVITPRLRCEGEKARSIESTLLWTMVGRELFDDDTPIAPTYDISWSTRVSPFGISPKRSARTAAKGYHIEPVIEDLEEDFEKLQGGSFSSNKEGTLANRDFINDIF